MSGLLLETNLDADQRDFAETIRRGAESLLVVINDSLDFSKIEAGKLEIDPVDFALDSVVEDAAEFLSQQASLKTLEITALVAPDVPDYLHGDNVRVQQILINLLNNAIKFTDRGEIGLRVSVARRSGNRTILRFEVRDTGIGIAPEVQARLFQPFSQADGSTTRKYGGTGLGLAICKRLTELMSGEIGVASELGNGAVFWVELPFGPPRAPRSPDQIRPVGLSLAGLKALVVDDNAANRVIVKQHLESWQIGVDGASDALQAITMLRVAERSGQPYSLAVLDYGMPGMHGVDLARIIRSDGNLASMQLIMLSSYSEREKAEQARQVGISIYLLKPLRKSQLCRALEMAFRPLPVNLAPAFSSGLEPAVKPALPGGHKKILLVEDHPDNQKLAVRLLARNGFECDLANNGAEAISMMLDTPYALVLMDCQMPVMDGFQATAAIREGEGNVRSTRIIAMTAHSMQGDREKCLAAGMDDYIPKPVDEKALIRTIERWLSAGAAPGSAPNPAPAVRPAEPAAAGPGKPRRLRIPAKAGMEDLIPDYLKNRLQDLQALSAALDNGDLKTAQTIGHTMKGSGAGYGFPEVTSIGQAIEYAARGGDVGAVQARIAELGDYLQRIEVTYP